MTASTDVPGFPGTTPYVRAAVATALLLAAYPIHLRLVTQVQPDVPLATVLGDVFSNTTLAVVAALSVRGLIGVPPHLHTVGNTTIFILVAAIAVPDLAAAMAAYIGVHTGWSADVWLTARLQFLGSVFAAVSVTPLILLMCTGGMAAIRGTAVRRDIEFAFLATALFLIATAIFGQMARPGNHPALLYVPLLVMLWAALRFGTAGLCLSTIVVAFLFLGNAVAGRGPFAARSPAENALSLHIFLISSAIPLMLLSAVVEERRRAAAASRESEERFHAMIHTALRESRKRYAMATDGSETPNRQEQDGSARWFLARGSTVRRADGRACRMVGTDTDITERKRVEEALRENDAALHASYQQIQELAGRLIVAQETERARIARDLHDDISQQLAGLSIALSGLKRRLKNDPAVVSDLTSLQQCTRNLTEEIRRLSHDLHPGVLQHAGLVPAVKSHCVEFARLHGVEVIFKADPDVGSIHAEVALCLYRIVQEALRNTSRHADARRIHVVLARQAGALDLTIRDDGRGFDLARVRRTGGGLGLLNIEERARLVGGTIRIDTQPHRGTTMHVRVPLQAARRLESAVPATPSA